MSDESARPLSVFLCHSSADKSQVRKLYNRLRADNVEPWLDEINILPGQDWHVEITKAVKSADVVVVCLSKGSVTKEGYVQKEMKLALDVADEKPEGTIFIIPLKLEECLIPSRIMHYQWVNFYEKDGYSRLIMSLRMRAKAVGALLPDSFSALPKPRVLSRPSYSASDTSINPVSDSIPLVHKVSMPRYLLAPKRITAILTLAFLITTSFVLWLKMNRQAVSSFDEVQPQPSQTPKQSPEELSEKATTEPSSKSIWRAKIINASSPNKVTAYDVGRGGREAPSKGQQWVFLTVEVTPPDREITEIPQFNVKVMPGDVMFDDVRIVDKAKKAYQTLAIDCPKKNSSVANPTFLFLESLKKPESLFYYGGKDRWNQFRDEVHGNRLAGFVYADDTNDWVVFVWDIGMLRFKPKKTSAIFLLFETPITSEQLSFQIGDSSLIPIRLAK